MATLIETRNDVRAHLNEASARLWTDAQLNTWINEGLRDIARRTETIQKFSSSIAVTANDPTYTLPAEVLRVHRAEWVPTASGLVFPLQLATYNEMDQYWGVNGTTMPGQPQYLVMWGFPPTVEIRLWPVPAEAGAINLFYFRLPAVATLDADTIEVLAGYEDLIVLYCEYIARRKDRDPTWQEAKALYEERVTLMVETTRQWHDQAQVISVGASAVPRWLYEFGSF